MADRSVTISVFGDDGEFLRMVEEIKALKRSLADPVTIKVKTDGPGLAGDTKQSVDQGILSRLLFGNKNDNGSSIIAKINQLISKIPYVGQGLSSLGALGAPALAGIAASVVSIVGVLGSMVADMTAAAMGIGALGALAIPTFSKITAAISGTKGAMAGLSPAQKQVVNGVKAIEAEWSRMAKTFAPMLTPLMKTLVNIGQKLLPQLLPFAERAATAVGGLLKQLDRAVSSAGFKQFMATMLKWSGPEITAIGKGILQVAQAIGSLLKGLAGPAGIIGTRLLFDGIAGAIHLIGIALQGAAKFSFTFAQALLTAARIGLEAIKGFADGFLNTMSGITKALSHLPGLGFLSKWSSQIDQWRSTMNKSLNGAISNLNQWKQDVANAPKIVTLQANISNLQSRLATARSLLNNPDLTKTRRAQIQANISQLKAQIAAARAMLAALNGTTVNTYVRTVPIGGGRYITGGYASGTPSAIPGWHWVGELGPELINFSGGEQVMSNAASMAANIPTPAPMAASSARSAPIIINFNGVVGDPNAVAREVQTILLGLKRRRGGGALGLA